VACVPAARRPPTAAASPTEPPPSLKPTLSLPLRLGRKALALAAAAALGCCRCCQCAEGTAGPFGGGGGASAGPSSGPLPPTPPRLTIEEDPLDLAPSLPSDYRNWASLLARILLTKANGDGDAATASLGRLMLTAHGLLARAADGGEDFLPRLHLTDPVFTQDAAAARAGFAGWLDALDGQQAKIKKGAAAVRRAVEATPTFVTGKIVTRNFFEFSPCVLSETPVGAAAELTGINFVANLVSIAPVGFTGYIQGKQREEKEGWRVFLLFAFHSSTHPLSLSLTPKTFRYHNTPDRP
jgi:hypothetical protein